MRSIKQPKNKFSSTKLLFTAFVLATAMMLGSFFSSYDGKDSVQLRAQLPTSENSFDFEQRAGSDPSVTIVGFGEECAEGSPKDCDTGLTCYTTFDYSNTATCVQCADSNDCSKGQCKDKGVCVGNNGLSSDVWCTKDSHCISKKCKNNKCEKASGGTSSTSSGDKGGTGSGPKNNDTGSTTDSGTDENFTGVDLTIDQIVNFVVVVACNAQRIGVLLAVIALLYLAYQYFYATYDPNVLKDVKQKFGYVILGLVLVFGVYIIIATVANAVGVKSVSFFSCEGVSNILPEVDESLQSN